LDPPYTPIRRAFPLKIDAFVAIRSREAIRKDRIRSTDAQSPDLGEIMFSVNVPLPPAIDRLAADLQPKLSEFDRIRDRHTLVCKRVGVEDVVESDRNTHGVDGRERERALERLREAIYPVLADTDPFRVSVTGIDAFGDGDDAFGHGDDAVVAYLAVESPELVRLHRRLCRPIDPVDGIEGDGYVPHITLVRGDDPGRRTVDRLLDAEIDPVAWRVHALDLYDAEFREVAETIDLGPSNGQ